jgi:hypothetical protein
MLSVPARCFFRSRRVSFLATCDDGQSASQLVRGPYQSPILVQWQSAVKQARNVDVTIVEIT